MASDIMVEDHSDSERGTPLPPHGLLFPISSKSPFISMHSTHFYLVIWHQTNGAGPLRQREVKPTATTKWAILSY